MSIPALKLNMLAIFVICLFVYLRPASTRTNQGWEVLGRVITAWDGGWGGGGAGGGADVEQGGQGRKAYSRVGLASTTM